MALAAYELVTVLPFLFSVPPLSRNGTFRRSEVSQKGKGELPKRVENRRLSTLLGPARERRSPAVRRRRNPQPGNGVLLTQLGCTGERLPRNGLPPGKGVLLSGLVCTGKRLLRIDKSKFGCVPLCATGAASAAQNRPKSPYHVDKLWTDLGISPHRTGRNRKTCNAQKNEQLFAKIAKTIKIARILAEYFVQ